MVSGKTEEIIQKISKELQETDKDKMEILKGFIKSDIVKLGNKQENRFFIDSNLPKICNLTLEERKILLDELGKEEEREELYSKLEEETDIIEIHPEQDYNCKEGINYSFKTRESKYIVTSRRNIYSYKDCEEKGLKLKNNGVKEGQLSPKTAVSYARDCKKVQASKVFEEVRNMIKRFVIFEVESFYTVLAIWILHTYVYKIFLYVPYLWINRR